MDELLFNEGFSEVRVRGGDRPGDSVHVETRPARSFPALRTDIVTIASAPCSAGDSAAAGHCPVTSSRFARRRELTERKDTLRGDVIVTGSVAAGDTVTLEVTHRDPDLAYLAAFSEALRDRGIAVDSGTAVTEDSTATHGDTLVTIVSKPLREILPALLKPSQNQIAEVLLRHRAMSREQARAVGSARRTVAERWSSDSWRRGACRHPRM